MGLRAGWIQLKRDLINRKTMCVCWYVHMEAQNNVE